MAPAEHRAAPRAGLNAAQLGRDRLGNSGAAAGCCCWLSCLLFAKPVSFPAVCPLRQRTAACSTYCSYCLLPAACCLLPAACCLLPLVPAICCLLPPPGPWVFFAGSLPSGLFPFPSAAGPGYGRFSLQVFSCGRGWDGLCRAEFLLSPPRRLAQGRGESASSLRAGVSR